MKILGYIAVAIITVIAISFLMFISVYFWFVVLVLIVTLLYHGLQHFLKLENTGILKIAFVCLYFVLFTSISSYMKELGYDSIPEVRDEYAPCANGYVCY